MNPDRGSDHYLAATDAVVSAAPRGDSQVAVSHFRTQRVPGQNDGLPVFASGQPGVQAEPSQYLVAAGRGLRTPFADRQVSPTFPLPAGNQAGFNGDYSGLVIVGRSAHPIWSDTRNTAPAGQVSTTPAPNEDIFTDDAGLPRARTDRRSRRGAAPRGAPASPTVAGGDPAVTRRQPRHHRRTGVMISLRQS